MIGSPRTLGLLGDAFDGHELVSVALGAALAADGQRVLVIGGWTVDPGVAGLNGILGCYGRGEKHLYALLRECEQQSGPLSYEQVTAHTVQELPGLHLLRSPELIFAPGGGGFHNAPCWEGGDQEIRVDLDAISAPFDTVLVCGYRGSWDSRWTRLLDELLLCCEPTSRWLPIVKAVTAKADVRLLVCRAADDPAAAELLVWAAAGSAQTLTWRATGNNGLATDWRQAGSDPRIRKLVRWLDLG